MNDARRWMFVGLGLLAACVGSDKDTAKQDQLTETTVLRDADFETCERGLFFPSGNHPVIGHGLTPVEPPYEITHVGAEVFDSGDDWCVPDAGMKIVLWVGDEAPSELPNKANGRPDFPTPLAEVVVGTTETQDGRGFAEVALDPPVRVEESGTLWVVAVNFQADGVAARNTPCLAGCGIAGESSGYQFDETDLWEELPTQLPLFQVTVRH